jgi:hypothetical protein
MQQTASATLPAFTADISVPLTALLVTALLFLQQLEFAEQQYARFMQHTGSAAMPTFSAVTEARTFVAADSFEQHAAFVEQQWARFMQQTGEPLPAPIATTARPVTKTIVVNFANMVILHLLGAPAGSS